MSHFHSLDPAETGLPGPILHGRFGRRAGSVPGYEFSEGTLPGTLMGFVGLRDAGERKALIEYLQRATQ